MADDMTFRAGDAGSFTLWAEVLGPVIRMHDREADSALVEGLGFEIVPVYGSGAEKVAEAYARWGKGVHAASLNFGDCFAYALARETGAGLLFVGDDFARTDVEPAAG